MNILEKQRGFHSGGVNSIGDGSVNSGGGGNNIGEGATAPKTKTKTKIEVSIIYVEGDKSKVSRTIKNVMDNKKCHGQ